ncbi:MAG: nitroreductase [Deltaproteobacteria bacterium]|nr:nitroreductase [Deltaproteobacteria bacterium]
MDVETALRTRRSIRQFLPDPIPEATVRELLDAARWAPSGGNLQPWRVIVLTGAPRAAVSELAQRVLWSDPRGEPTPYPVYPPELWEPYRSRRYVLGEALYAVLGIPREDRGARLAQFGRNYDFFGAPVALFPILDERMGHGQWGHLGMFLQSLALAATARGLGTCMQEAWGVLRPSLGRHLGLAEHEVVTCGVALGRPDPLAPVNELRSTRVPVDEFATFRGFDDPPRGA